MRSFYTTLKISTYVTDNTRVCVCVMVSIDYSTSLVSNVTSKQMEFVPILVAIPFRPHYDSGVDLASNRNEYQVCVLGVKAVGA